MWVLKLETSHEGSLITDLARRYSISFQGYPIKYDKSGNNLVVQAVANVDIPKDKVRFFKKKLTEEKFIEKFYFNKGFVIIIFKVPLWLSVLYSPEIIFTKPQIYDSSGKEIMELACFSRKPLEKLVKVYQEKYKTKILSFKKQDISNISIVSTHPYLTAKQWLALKLAIEHGYYKFPKKITLKELAKIMGVCFSTYQAHLSKAESQFMAEMFKKAF